MVRKVDLPGLQVDIMTLEDLRELTLEDRIDNMEKERELMGRISDRLMDHVAPPVQIGLGKGRVFLAAEVSGTVACDDAHCWEGGSAGDVHQKHPCLGHGLWDRSGTS